MLMYRRSLMRQETKPCEFGSLPGQCGLTQNSIVPSWGWKLPSLPTNAIPSPKARSTPPLNRPPVAPVVVTRVSAAGEPIE